MAAITGALAFLNYTYKKDRKIIQMCNRFFLVVIVVLFTSGCINSDYVNSESQVRMQRCEQYIGMNKERCLNGELVTIEEYKEDLQDFQQKTEEKKN